MSLDPRPSDADLRRIAAERWAARGDFARGFETLNRMERTLDGIVSRAHTILREVTGNPWAPYRSKWEREYAERLELERRAGLIVAWQYEARRFTIGIRRTYRPDFRVVYRANGRLRVRYVEVKGNIRMRNARDGVTRLAAAALLYPQYDWEIATLKGGAWTHTRIAA